MYGYLVKVARLIWTVFEFVSAAAWAGLGPYKKSIFCFARVIQEAFSSNLMKIELWLHKDYKGITGSQN